jgi:hypothetical protein
MDSICAEKIDEAIRQAIMDLPNAMFGTFCRIL